MHEIIDGTESAILRRIPEYAWDEIKKYIEEIKEQQIRPSILLRPNLIQDGNGWICLYGNDFHSGLSGVGDTPEEAMEEFDFNYTHNANSTVMLVDPQKQINKENNYA